MKNIRKYLKITELKIPENNWTEKYLNSVDF